MTDAVSTWPSRTALVAIHGVGDPLPGDTAADVAKLLVAQQNYAHQGAAPWLVAVHEVEPNSDAAPHSKAWVRYSSPFVGAHMGTPDASVPAAINATDLGTQLNHHLLRGTVLDDKEKTFSSVRHALRKEGRTVDVIDMYWGDLSGLGKSAWRIVVELFTLVFHLCQLGRDTAQHTAIYLMKKHSKRVAAARVFAVFHEAADLLLTKPNGMLNALMVAVALWWLPLYYLLQSDAASHWLHARPVLAQGVAAAWAVAVAVVFAGFAWFCDGLVRRSGVWALVLGLGVLAALAWGWPSPEQKSASGLRELWSAPAMAAIDLIMALLLIVWALMALATLGLIASGSYLKLSCRVGTEMDPVVVQGVDTGRFGLLGSTTLFVSLTCAAWALALKTVKISFVGLPYKPLLPTTGAQASSTADAAVNSYYIHSTSMFSVIALLLVAILVLAVFTLAPSVWREIVTPTAGVDGQKGGRWLSGWGAALVWLVSKLAVLGTLAFVAWGGYALWESVWGTVPAFALSTSSVSDSWLNTLTYVAAGSAVTLTAIGARVFGILGKTRIALDAALDVDKHFREFPDHSTPRGRIAARLLSVLNAAKADGYDRIVIAAHSQGTIIVAELLRYLTATKPEAIKALPPIHLLTCGSPLRQLYSARFPALYRNWVESKHTFPKTTGPLASALGVQRWTNAYCTGDYVGRWLWERDGQNLLAKGESLDDGTHRQLCLGQGAHTHYYDARMATMAEEIDKLLK